MADDILNSLDPALRAQLADETLQGAFLFGHVAPDARQVSRQPRGTTHFIRVPPTNHRPSHLRLLDAHPALAQAAALPAPQAAFMSGYLAHLLFDELWMREIYLPLFGPDQNWDDRHERILLHNALRTWLDRRDWPHLRADLGHMLRQAQPASWLAFISDDVLCRWRDLVAAQLTSDGAIRTAEFFAGYSRVSLEDFLTLLEPDVMQARVFARVSLAALDEFQARATAHCRELIINYLTGANSCAMGKSG
jgi:hypothetical protein